jgi:hypothetical protein
MIRPIANLLRIANGAVTQSARGALTFEVYNSRVGSCYTFSEEIKVQRSGCITFTDPTICVSRAKNSNIGHLD